MPLLLLCLMVSRKLLCQADVSEGHQTSTSSTCGQGQSSLPVHSKPSIKLGVQTPPDYPLTPQQLASTNSSMSLWSEKYHFFACLIPKCASSSWLDLMYEMHLSATELQHQKEAPGNERVKGYPNDGFFQRVASDERLEEQAKAALNDPTYFKFTVVRHPWSRLVSGYLNKYVVYCQKDRACFQKKFMHEIDASLHEPMSLSELLLTLEHIPGHQINQHFRVSAMICNVRPGLYDFIADMETQEHTEYILTKIKSPFSLPVTNNNPALLQHNPDALKVACTRETVDLAARFYALDLETYGYTMDAAYESCEKYGLAHPPE
jgi:hypothetical protein